MGNNDHITGEEVYKLVLDGATKVLTDKTVLWANEILGRRYGSISGARSSRGQLRSSGVDSHIERAVITWERVN